MISRRKFIKQAGLGAAGLLSPPLTLHTFTNGEDRNFAQLREAIAVHAKCLKIPGVAVAVVKDAKVVFVQTEGFADLDQKIPVRRDHIFPVASLTKTFAAVTLMQCQQEGKASLEDYVLDYPFLSVGFTPERLQTPNVKIKHIISHTSEGEPGANFIYNGGRYNFCYGIFEKISGNTKHYEAFADEVNKRIIQPLKLKNTLAGYPVDKDHPALASIVTTYNWDRENKLFKKDKSLPGQTTLYPSAGLLTTIDDLAAYSQALDQNTLLTAESYQNMTSPFVSNSGRANPYGLGWATQTVYGHQVHWAYGYGDSYATLLIRLPHEKLTFILLSNAVPASEAFVLGYGNILNSVFAHAFFKHIIFQRNSQFSYESLNSKSAPAKDQLLYDEVFSQAMMRNYVERHYQEHQGEDAILLRYLAQHDPERFKQLDISLIYLMAKTTDPQLNAPMESAIEAYAASGWFHPDIHGAIAGWQERNNNVEAAKNWYHQLADSPNYGEQGPVKNACTWLGKYYLANGKKEKGRSYLWRTALYSRYNDSGLSAATRQINLMQL